MRVHVDCNSLARGFLMEQICILSYAPLQYYYNGIGDHLPQLST